MYCIVPSNGYIFASSNRSNHKVMKTTSLQISLVLVLLLLAGFTVHAASYKRILVPVTKYEQNWIPSVELKEIVIKDKAPVKKQPTLAHMTKRDGKMIPSVLLPEVDINASGDYSTRVAKTVAHTGKKVKLLPAVKIDGDYMASVNLKEVEISAEGTENTSLYESESASEESATKVETSVRKTFDRLAGYLAEKSRNVIRKLVPSWFSK